MNFVYPIKEKEKIQAIKEYLAKSPRDLLMFTIGLNSALRISDILSLTVGQVKSGYVVMKEQKTKKTKRFPLNTSIMDVLIPYIADKCDDEYLFASRKGGKPISRIQAYRIIKDASKKCGLKDIATHSMRKSFGYNVYEKTKDIALVQQLLNHSSPAISLRYIGITQDKLDNIYEEINLWN